MASDLPAAVPPPPQPAAAPPAPSLSARGWGLLKSVVKAWIGACLVLFFLQEWILFPGPVTPADRPYPFRRPFEAVVLPVDGAELAAVRFPVENARGTVLHFHGNGQCLEQMEYLAALFAPFGMEVFAIDYRGYGKSTGRIRSEAELHADALAAYRYATEKLGRPPERVLIHGTSIGTGLAVRLAAEHPCGGVLLEAPYFSIQDLALGRHPWLPSFLLKYPLRSDLWIGKVRAPVTLFHGVHDEIIPYNHSQRLLPLVQAPKKLVTFPDGRHNDLVVQPGYREALAEIFKDWPGP